MKIEIVHIFGIIAIFQSLFLSFFFLAHKKGAKISNRLFAALLLVFALVVTYSFSNSSGMYKQTMAFRKEFFLLAQTAFLIAPLLYLYIKSLLDGNFYLSKTDLIHLIPFLFSFVYVFISLSDVENLPKSIHQLGFFYSASLLILESLYLLMIYLYLKKHEISLLSAFSGNGDSKLLWLRFFILGFIIIWNVKLQTFLVMNVEEKWEFCPYTESIYFLSMFLFFNSIIFIALKKPELFSSFRKYEKSELSEADKENYQNMILEYFESEKPYLDPTLTLPGLSKKLSIHTRYLSQIINESFNKNFNDFINEYRITESKKMLQEENNGKKTMLEIAYYAGFNSKSSFYEAFKRHTGLTPREYKMNFSTRVKISLN